MRKPLLFSIPKTSSVEHVEENARAIELTLTGDVVKAIDEAFPRGRDRNGVPTI